MSNCRSHRAKLISATYVALTLLAAQAAAAPTAEQAKEAGRRVGANTSNAVRSSAMDEETVQKLQGGGLYAKGSVNSSNGYSGSVTTTLKLSCGDGEAQSTRTGTRVATSYCSGSSAIISLCRSAIEEGRPCESADWFDTPGIGSGSSYSDADFTIEIGDCSGTPAGGTCTAKITEQETKTTNPNDLTALGNSRASSSASNSLYARNVALANGTQTVTTPTQTFSYRSKTESGSQWVNQNEKISQKYAATSHIVSDPSACFNGVCGQDHGPFNTSLYLGNCTTQCNGTTTTTTTSVRQCTVPTDTFSRFCTQPTANQTCTIRRQYTESTCSTTSSDGFETPDPSSCPQSVSGMCWRYKRTRSTTPAGCYMAREGAPTFALNRTGRLQKVAYRAGGIELAAVPCQFVDTSYYRCDTGAEPVISCTDGTTGAGCTSGPIACATDDPRANSDPTMGTCLNGTIQKSCPVGTPNCLGDAPAEGAPGCTSPTTACVYDSTDPNAGCPASVSDGSQQGEPSGDPYCTCMGTGQTCSTASSPSVENTCAQYETNPRCTYQSEITATDPEDGTPSYTTKYFSCAEDTTVCTDSTQVCSDTEEAAPPYSGFEQVAAASTIADQIADGVADSTTNGGVLKIFSGKAADCKKPIDTGSTVTKNCCRDGLTKEENKLFNTCDSEDVDIASAKRTNRATNLASYCSKKISLGFTSICVEKTQTYCLFPSTIARVIQEQGREQLSGSMASSSGGPWNSNVNFSYFGSGSAGQWVALGGHYETAIYAWQWPAGCSDPNYAQGSGTARYCPAAGQVYIAACRSGRCPALSTDPRYGPPPQTDWRIAEYNRDRDTNLAITDNAQASGSCPTYQKDAAGNVVKGSTGTPVPNNQCTYTVGVTQRLVSGEANLSSEISWPAYVGSPGFDTSKASISGYYFQGYVFGDGAQADAMPPSVQVRVTYDPNGVQSDGGFSSSATSTTVYLSTNQASKTNFSAFGKTFTYSGGCRRDIQYCIYQIAVSVPIAEKPWCGSSCKKSRLDCSGFTPEQFASLDMSKIDLSEVANDLARPTSSPDVSGAEATIIGQTSSLMTDYVNGNASTQAGAQSVLKLFPDNGDPDWTTTLTATGNYPQNGEGRVPVDSVSVDWGDGTPATLVSAANSGTAFKATHTYTEVINGVDSKNRVFYLAVTFNLSNGQSKTVPARVQSWRNTKPTDPTRMGGASGSSDSYDPRVAPSGNNVGSVPAKPQPTGP